MDISSSSSSILNDNNYLKLKKGTYIDRRDDDFNQTKTYFNYNDETHSSEILKILNVLRKNRQLCDLIIQIDNNNNDIYCHQLILACNSKLFMQMFLDNEEAKFSGSSESISTCATNGNDLNNDSQRLIHKRGSTNGYHCIPTINKHANKHYLFNLSKYIKNINDYTYEALRCCINYMYTSKLEISINDLELIENVYLIAYKLEFERIIEICSQYLISNLNETNCLQIRSYALDINLIKNSTEFIEKQINKIRLTNEFCALPRINIEIVLFKKDYKNLFNLTDDDNDSELPPSPLNKLIEKWLYTRLLIVDKQNNNKLDCLIQQQLNMLYVNDDDKLLHDCCDMDETNQYYSDYIHDYQQALKRTNSSSSSSSTTTSSNGLPKLNATVKITNKELYELNEIPFTHDDMTLPQNNKIICIHKTNENSLIILSMVNGTMVTLNVHVKILEEKQNDNCELLSINNNNDENNKLIINGINENLINNNGNNHELLIQTNNNDDIKVNNGELKLNGTHNKTIINGYHYNNTISDDTSAKKLSKMQSARCSHGLVGFNNQLFIIGGYDRGECLSKCEIFDLKMNKMLEFNDLNQRRGRASIVWHEKTQTIYVLGGSDGHQELDSMECFNLNTKKWSLIQFSVSFLCSNVASYCVNDSIYLVGIQDKNGIQRHCLKYDVNTNEFKRIASLTHGRSQCAMICHKDMLYVFGGHDQIRCLNTCERLSLKDNTWSQLESMIEHRRGFGAAYKSGYVYLVGGTNGSCSLRSMEIYDIKTNKFTIGPQLNTPRANVSIAFVGNYLFAAGGFDGKSFLRTIEYLNINDLKSGWSIYHQNYDLNDNN